MLKIALTVCVCFVVSACSHTSAGVVSHVESVPSANTTQKQYVEELSQDIEIFDTVAFGLGLPLRKYLNDTQVVNGKTILDLGAGSGVLSFIAIKNGAAKSVATDINPNAVANAEYNARHLGFEDKIEVRLVPMEKQGAYSVIEKSEKFDLIVSNPPQHPEQPKTLYEYSYADPKLAFLRSMLEGLSAHLKPGGKGVFALYDQGLNLARQMAHKQGFDVNVRVKTKNRNGTYYLVEIMRATSKNDLTSLGSPDKIGSLT